MSIKLKKMELFDITPHFPSGSCTLDIASWALIIVICPYGFGRLRIPHIIEHDTCPAAGVVGKYSKLYSGRGVCCLER